MDVPDVARLIGTEVRSSDGQALGRIGAVYVQEGSVQPLLVAFPAERDKPQVAPLFRATLTPQGLILGYSAAQLESGPRVDADAALSVGEISAVLNHYAPPVSTGTDLPVTERITEVGDVSSTEADVRAIPSFPFIGDEDLPPIVVTKPGLTGLAG